jgi:phosphoribosylpyrophosphate synthetase
MSGIKVFGLDSTHTFASKVANELGVDLSSKSEDYFEDGETTLRSQVNVRGQDVFVIQSLYSCDKESVTVSPYRLNSQVSSKLSVISTAKPFAEAIRRINEEDSISDLLV